MKAILRLTIWVMMSFVINANCQSKMMPIKGGTYIPLYGRDSLKVTIDDFDMDVYPVTNEQFVDFVIKNPTWKKSNVIKLFADGSYLIDWSSVDAAVPCS